jgi:hypothetical protein
VKTIRFIPYRISINPNIEYHLAMAEQGEKSYDRFFQLEELIVNTKRFPFQSKTDMEMREIVFLHLEKDKNSRLVQGKLGVQTKMVLSDIVEEKDDFEDTLTDHYPNISFIWNYERQTILLPKNVKSVLSMTLEGLVKKLEKVFSQHYSDRSITIRPIRESRQFWDCVDKMDKIEWIYFELLPPNLWGDAPEDLSKFTQELQKTANVSNTGIKIANVKEGLRVSKSNSFVKNALNETARYGGDWKIKGDGQTVSGNDQKPIEFDAPITEDAFNASDIICKFNEFDHSFDEAE